VSIVLRYLPRYLADHLLTRGAAMLVVGAVMALPVLLAAGGSGTDPEALRRLLGQVIGNVSVFLILIATAGVVGTDIRQGHYRFLLCKPFSPVAYYGAAFGATLVSFLTVVVAFIGVFALVRDPVWPGVRPFVDWSINFLLLGGLVFACSRFTRLDWLVAVAAFILGDVARNRWPASESVLGAGLNVLLPPSGRDSYFADGGAAVWGHIGWAVGYAAVTIALGLLAVRYVPPGEHR
jgi:ABC-type transport system involved in multi-copper enzyme maturation permease subunit